MWPDRRENGAFVVIFFLTRFMLIQATQLRVGMVIESNGLLWRVAAVEHITPGNWRGMVQARLRNVKTGAHTENRFRSEERVERVTLDQARWSFSIGTAMTSTS
jgi:translation elongation factor P/translation initiation factor 5A